MSNTKSSASFVMEMQMARPLCCHVESCISLKGGFSAASTFSFQQDHHCTYGMCSPLRTAA